MTYEPVCADCDGALSFSGIVWRHVEPGVGHAPIPRRALTVPSGRHIVEITETRTVGAGISTRTYRAVVDPDEDWVLPTRGD